MTLNHAWIAGFGQPSMVSMNTAVLAAARRAPPSLLVPALLACYLVWGSTYLAIRWALVSFPPFFQMGTRFLAAGGLLMAWVTWRARRDAQAAPWWPTARQWCNALVVGTLMLGGGMGLVASAEQHIGSGLIAAFIAIVPMWVCGWGLIFGQRPSRLELAGMVVGLAGVLLLVRGASFAAAPAGLACIVGATLAWSLGSVLSTTKLPLAPGAAGFASEMLCGGAVLMLVSLALGEQFTAARSRSRRSRGLPRGVRIADRVHPRTSTCSATRAPRWPPATLREPRDRAFPGRRARR
jgi:drug/metabolite transporter (DMT)-like permease